MMWPLLQLDPVAQGIPCGPTLWLKRPTLWTNPVAQAPYPVDQPCGSSALPSGPTLWLKRLPSGPAEPEPQGRGWVGNFATVSNLTGVRGYLKLCGLRCFSPLQRGIETHNTGT